MTSIQQIPITTSTIVESDPLDAYQCTTYIGKHTIKVQAGDCLFALSNDGEYAHSFRGPKRVNSSLLGVVIRGYAPDDKVVSLLGGTNLPYINGCSTRQLFPPERPGDPTMQMLHMPKHTSEQAHHIHTTVRVVYVARGEGVCHVGNGTRDDMETYNLRAGQVLILPKMTPHHFVTRFSDLVVYPIHVWSSVPGSGEFNHPMFNGTHKID